jgi:hypothetical protein
MARRLAFLIGNGEFRGDSRLSSLQGPKHDVHYFAAVLQNSDYGGFEVTQFIDSESYTLQRAIESSLNEADRDDLVLVYYSGHGKLDSRGQLCLATANTNLDTLRSTSMSTAFLKGLFDDCRSNRIVLILDCCFSGAAGKSFTGVKGTVEDQLAIAQGRGIHILTSSTAIETSAEREQERDGLVAGVFTRCLVDGIVSGEADVDNDASITIEDLRRYLGRRIRGQSPRYWGFETSHDVVIARNPHFTTRPTAAASPDAAAVRGEAAFTLPVAILSIAALSSEVVGAILEASDKTSAAQWTPVITSALIAAVPWVRPAQARYRALVTAGLALLVLRHVVEIGMRGLAGSTGTAFNVESVLRYSTFIELGAFGSFVAAFATRGGQYPSALLVPYATFATVISVRTFSHATLLGFATDLMVVAAAYTAGQAWYRHGNPGSSWAAFGGILWLGFEFIRMLGFDLEGALLSLPAAATWLVAMSVRESVTDQIRQHPASSRWVLAGSLAFFLWFLVARVSVFTLQGTEIYDIGPVAAALLGTVVWCVIGSLIVVIFQGPARAWPWKLFIGTGLLATVACCLLVQNEMGSREMFFPLALACSVWPMALLAPFAREAASPISPLDSQTDRAVWTGAVTAIAWSIVMIPEIHSGLGSIVYYGILIIAGLGLVISAFLAETVYRRHGSVRAKKG